MNNKRALFAGLLVVLFTSSAYAQDDINLLTKVVPPNVMILVDNSGSMAHGMWHGDFDQKVFYDIGTVTTACDIPATPVRPGSTGHCPGSGDATSQCPESGSSLSDGDRVTVSRTDEGGWRLNFYTEDSYEGEVFESASIITCDAKGACEVMFAG